MTAVMILALFIRHVPAGHKSASHNMLQSNQYQMPHLLSNSPPIPSFELQKSPEYPKTEKKKAES